MVPLAALAAYPLLAALGARFGSHPLWQRYGRPAQDLLEANKVRRDLIVLELAGFGGRCRGRSGLALGFADAEADMLQHKSLRSAA